MFFNGIITPYHEFTARRQTMLTALNLNIHSYVQSFKNNPLELTDTIKAEDGPLAEAGLEWVLFFLSVHSKTS